MLRQRRQGVSGRLVAEFDAIGDLQAGGLAGLLDLADHVPRDPGEAEFRRDVQIQRHRRTCVVGDRPSGAWSLGDDDLVHRDDHRLTVHVDGRLTSRTEGVGEGGRLGRHNRCGDALDRLAEPLAQGAEVRLHRRVHE